MPIITLFAAWVRNFEESTCKFIKTDEHNSGQKYNFLEEKCKYIVHTHNYHDNDIDCWSGGGCSFRAAGIWIVVELDACVRSSVLFRDK